MVANSALIKAREEREYYSLCVKQPIGKNLFQLFCQSRPDLQNYICLLEALDAFEMKSDEERKDFGVSIIQRFLMRQSMQCVYVVQKHERSCIHSLEVDSCTDVFQSCREDLHNYLSGEPFSQYQQSMFFERFLQWKMLERRPITKYIFRQYRVLGKGGFGEVWACQVRATGMMYACRSWRKLT
ncbi:G protein-coupled receptor kinase 5 [Dissostichus eleginoides]|uniref:G protein-coupled receptor kinase 5 n=1 Tax=Dissostichus eleginoides TaxID=100907 RepID=A0AAD9EZ88_DISEL|nr:G protein-coupled receptor kinase 5 [Dissostichus eleginoides]